MDNKPFDIALLDTYALARECGVCQATIHQIHVGKIWKEQVNGY